MTKDNHFDNLDGAYEKMIDTLQGLDLKHLNDLYFQQRENFLKDAKESSHDVFKTRLLYAVIASDVCMEVYREFLVAMGQQVEKINAKAQQTMDEHQVASKEALDKLNELLQEVQSHEKSEFDDEYKSSVELRKSIYENMIKTRQDLAVFLSSTHTFSIYIVTLSSVSTFSSLVKLFEIKDFTLIGDVLILATQTLIGLNPWSLLIGTLGPAIWGLTDVFKKKAEQYKKAGDLLTKLDNYSDAAIQWCIFTQMLIEIGQGSLSLNENAEKSDEVENLRVGDQEIERISQSILAKIENNVKKYTESPQ